ncbi:hypothetical protein AGMMS50212_13050 [Spirochaetia bacterium]|nr:hypothetical protein AGMMS50212_13050 [Spirochaetia bacterium]
MNCDFFFSVSGWIFGLISCVAAIIQTVEKNKYKAIVNNQKAKAGNNSPVTQIGGISFGGTDGENGK